MKTLNEQLFERLSRLPHHMRMQLHEDFSHGGPPVPHPEGGFRTMPHRPPRAPFADGARPMPFHPTEGQGEGFRLLPRRPEEMRPEDGPAGPRTAFSRERILTLLSEQEEGMRQKEIGERMRMNPSSISEFINRLESDGYVSRQVDPQDRRATVITLTDLGRARAWEVQDMQEERLNRVFGNLTDDEKRQLIALLDKLIPAKNERFAKV